MIIRRIRCLISQRRVEKQKEYLLSHGLIVGENVNIDYNAIDGLYPWLIELGSNILFAPGVKVLAHDASTQMPLKKAKIGRVTIGSNVYVGLNSIILCNTHIGDNVIIGAGSIVTKDIPSNSVYAGNPARLICSYDEYIRKNELAIEERPNFESPFWIWPDKSAGERQRMKEALVSGIGYL